MSLRKQLLFCGSLLLLIVGLCVGISIGQGKKADTPKPEKLLPSNTVIYVGFSQREYDIGEDMVDTGEYGVFTPGSPGDEDVEEIVLPLAKTDEGTAKNQKRVKQIVGAKRAEWRTPPLWGVRDSAPYLHDGRAQTLKQAIAFHGGEGEDSTIRFFLLTPQQQQQVIAFLKTLTAPAPKRFLDQNQRRLLSQRRQ